MMRQFKTYLCHCLTGSRRGVGAKFGLGRFLMGHGNEGQDDRAFVALYVGLVILDKCSFR